MSILKYVHRTDKIALVTAIKSENPLLRMRNVVCSFKTPIYYTGCPRMIGHVKVYFFPA